MIQSARAHTANPEGRLVGALLVFALQGGSLAGAAPQTVETTLCGLKITLDQQTGSILELNYPGPGAMLQTIPERGSLVDLACPVTEFEPLRLATRFSRGAQIEKSEGQVIIHVGHLGASRAVQPQGRVSATIKLTAAPDGRSILMSCAIDNQSTAAVRQVIFPDLMGIVPFAGREGTEFRSAGHCMKPFVELQRPENGCRFYAESPTIQTLKSGSCFWQHRMILRWMDVGALTGGFSLFQKRWLWDPTELPEIDDHREQVMLQLSEIDQKLRLMCLHRVKIEAGQTWRSKEYVLTPHRYGWAEGIEPFRQFVKQNWKREYPVPEHVRKGLGFRSFWMCQQYGMSPASQSVVYTFADLPGLAQEAGAHGLDELCAWHWYWSFQSPLPKPFPTVGTEEEQAKYTALCKQSGVNVQYFITCMLMANPSAQRYGLTPSADVGWTYHTDFIPRFRPDYGTARWAAAIPQNNKQWQEDIFNSCKHLADIGCPSIGWDMYLGNAAVEPNLYSLTSRIRACAKQADPESTFCGESGTEIERDAIHLDYTWNWGNYRDCRPYTSVMEAPRLNPNIDRSPRDVKLCFMDNLYMDIMPSAPDGPNGSARISDFPDLSRALKQCAGLRKQFLPYFLSGKLIGECLLSEAASDGAHVTAYVRSDRGLLIVMNSGHLGTDRAVTPQAFSLSSDLAHWIPSAAKQYEVNTYDPGGALLESRRISGAAWHTETGVLDKYGLALYEIIAR